MRVVQNLRVVGVSAALMSSTLVGVASTASADPTEHVCNGLVATIVGTEGDDVLAGTYQDDVIVALGGNDTVNGASGADTICGGDGNDTIRGNSQDDTIFGGDGDDLLSGDSGADVIDGGDGNDTISGNSQDDTIQGGDGDDNINGNSGNDALDGGNGIDIVDGSWQTDTCDDAETAPNCETITFNGEPDNPPTDPPNLPYECNGLVATIVGTEGDDVLAGTYQDDVIVALGGNDTVNGASGADTICGGDGNDTIRGNSQDDTIFGGDGDDLLSGDSGADVIDGGDGNDTISGNSQDDTIQGGDGDDNINGNSGNDALDGGNGIDIVDGSWQTDTCDDAETAISCETETSNGEPLEQATQLSVAQTCTAGLDVRAENYALTASQGDTITYDVTVRNDSAGSCLSDGATPASVSGLATFTTETDTFVSVVFWLEILGGDGTSLVIPQSSALATSGGEAPEGCPGLVADGCDAAVGSTVGYADFDDTPLAKGGEVSIPFRYFPTLQPDDAADIAALNGSVIVTMAATTSGGTTLIERVPTTMSTPPSTGQLTLSATTPDGTSSLPVPSIDAGEQVELANAFSYEVGAGDVDNVTAAFTASAATVDSDTVEAVTFVSGNPVNLAVLQPAVYPTASTMGHATVFTISASPTGVVTGSPTVTWPDGSTAATDDGTGGDLIEGDGVWTATFAWTPVSDESAIIEMVATVDEMQQSGSATVNVHSAGIPSSPEVLSDLNVVTDAGASFLADRIVIITEEDASPADVEASATAINAELVGYVGPGVWQIAVPAVSSRAELDTHLEAISGQPAVIGAQPDFVSRPDGVVQPNDPMIGDHLLDSGIDGEGLDSAWGIQTGDQPIIVAVLDSGASLNHPDLDAKLFAGEDFTGLGVQDIECSHGSAMSGIIGAETNNGEGIAGVNWGARILPVRVLQPGGPNGQCEIRNTNVSAAIDYSIAQGAKVLNMSFSGDFRSEDMVKALSRATAANRFNIAAAGNSGEREKRYPAAYSTDETFSSLFGLNGRTYSLDVLAVGWGDQFFPDDRGTRGPWVDIYAPGTNIPVPCEEASYCSYSGSSNSTAVVSGVVSLMVADQPDLSVYEGRLRLMATMYRFSTTDTNPTGGLDVDEYGRAGAMNPYEAIVNGSFEFVTSPWTTTGTVTNLFGLGPIEPRRGATMLSLSSGPDIASDRATATRTIDVPVDYLIDGELGILVWYNFVSEEYPEFVNGGFNDFFTVDVVLPDGSTERIVDESVDSTEWTPVSGIDFPGGDQTAGQSGWRAGGVKIPTSRLDGAGSITIVVSDRGDSSYDSIGLIDGIDLY